MNTTGIQNYLSNVFRPVVTYNASASNFIFTPKLEMSNIDTYSGNTVAVRRVDVGDANSNAYVGSNAGNSLIDLRACSTVSAFGVSAGNGISNVSNSVYIGYQAGQASTGASSTIAIGSGAGAAGIGTSNIFIGTGTKSAQGSSNIFIGHGIDLSSVSRQVRIGYSNQIPIAADLSRNWVGLAGVTSPTASNVALDVSGLTVSTGGFTSIQSNITVDPGTSGFIGKLKKGIVFVSAASDVVNYATVIYFAPDNSNGVALLGSNAGFNDITLSSDNISILNTSSDPYTYNYSITYFPLP
jgi:hypothetical protein